MHFGAGKPGRELREEGWGWGVVCGRLKLWNDTGWGEGGGRRRVVKAKKEKRWTEGEKGVSAGERRETRAAAAAAASSKPPLEWKLRGEAGGRWWWRRQMLFKQSHKTRGVMGKYLRRR